MKRNGSSDIVAEKQNASNILSQTRLLTCELV